MWKLWLWSQTTLIFKGISFQYMVCQGKKMVGTVSMAARAETTGGQGSLATAESWPTKRELHSEVPGQSSQRSKDSYMRTGQCQLPPRQPENMKSSYKGACWGGFFLWAFLYYKQPTKGPGPWGHEGRSVFTLNQVLTFDYNPIMDVLNYKLDQVCDWKWLQDCYLNITCKVTCWPRTSSKQEKEWPHWTGLKGGRGTKIRLFCNYSHGLWLRSVR